MFWRRTQRILVTVVTLVCLLIVGAGSLEAQDIHGQLMADIEAARREHSEQLVRFEAERSAFDLLLERIDVLKQGRDETSTIIGDQDLRTALREAREAAEDLGLRSSRLARLADRVSQLEEQLLADIDEEIAQLESELRTAERDSMVTILGELEALASLRERYLEPLPEVPEIPLDEILLGLDEETTPEELLATADELDDNERRLSDHLRDIEQRINALETQVELQQRAREFRAELSVFEEGVSDGRSAEARSSAAQPSGSNGTETTGSATPTANNTGAGAGGSEDDARSGYDSQDSQDADPSPGSEGEMPTGFTGGGAAEPDSPPPSDEGTNDDDVDTSSSLDGADNRTDGDGWSEPHTDVDIGDSITGLSPSLTPVPSPSSDGTILWVGQSEIDQDSDIGIGAQLQRLRAEREETRDTIEELRQRRQQLLERAEELEDLEGF